MHSPRLIALLVLCACQAKYPEGKIACLTEQQCPGGWVCEPLGIRGERYCLARSQHTDAAAESGMLMPTADRATSPEVRSPIDAGQHNAASTTATPMDAGRVAPDRTPNPFAFAVSMSAPGDGETLADPTGPLKVTFTERLDRQSVNATSFSVKHGGQAVPGDYDVQGSEVFFNPETRWELSGRYEVELTDKLRDHQLRELTPRRWSFLVRAGEWSMQRLSSDSTKTDKRTKLSVSSQGHAVLAWETEAHTIQAYRCERDAEWAALSTEEGSLLDVAIDDESRIALGTTSGVHLYGNLGVPATFLPYPDIKRVLFTLDELHVLYVRDGRLVEATRALSSGETSELIHSDAMQPVFADLTVYRAHGLAAWSQPEATDSGVVQSVWVSEIAQCDPDATCARRVCSQGCGAMNNSPLLASSADRSAVAVWTEHAALETDTKIVGTQLHDGTTSNWGHVISEAGAVAMDPALAAGGAGRIFAAWLQVAGSGVRVHTALYNPDLGSWKLSGHVSGDTMHFAKRVALAANGGGQALAVWAQASGRDDTHSDAIRSTLFADGESWDSAITRVTQAEIDGESISIGLPDDGRALVTWRAGDQIWVGRYQ